MPGHGDKTHGILPGQEQHRRSRLHRAHGDNISPAPVQWDIDSGLHRDFFRCTLVELHDGRPVRVPSEQDGEARLAVADEQGEKLGYGPFGGSRVGKRRRVGEPEASQIDCIGKLLEKGEHSLLSIAQMRAPVVMQYIALVVSPHALDAVFGENIHGLGNEMGRE